jgi:hypothetical protein
MRFILFPLLVVIPALTISLSMWLIMKKTKVEGSFLQIFLISIIVALVNLFPVFKEFISFAVLFLLLYKWEDVKFWPKVKFWPDSLLVAIIGWGACYGANYLLFMTMKLFR